MKVYFDIRMLDLMADLIHFPSKSVLKEMSGEDLEEYRQDLQRLQDHVDNVNKSMAKEFEVYEGYRRLRQSNAA